MQNTALLEKMLTTEEYLDAERSSTVKHEFDNGKPIEIAGGDLEHNLIKGEIYSLLKAFIQAQNLSHLVLDSDMKVWFPKLNKFVYPDVSVIGKPPQFYISPNGKIRRDALLNPVLIVEVLSDDTRTYDKGEKFERYCTLPSFREYMLVEPLFPWVQTMYFADTMTAPLTSTFTRPEDMIHLHTLKADLKLANIYRILEELA